MIQADAAKKERLARLLKEMQGRRSLRKFALDMDVVLRTMQNWVEARGMPTPENLRKIAAAAGMESVDDLYAYLEGEEFKYSPKLAEDVLRLALKLDSEQRLRLIKLIADSLLSGESE